MKKKVAISLVAVLLMTFINISFADVVAAVGGSCKNPSGGTYCNTKNPVSGCQCDAACDRYGDCCEDYTQTCDTTNDAVEFNSDFQVVLAAPMQNDLLCGLKPRSIHSS